MVHIGCVSGWIAYVRYVGRQVWGFASSMDLIGDSRLERYRDCTSTPSYSVSSFFLGESTYHGLDEGVRFPPPLTSGVKNKGISPSAGASQVFASLSALESSQSASACSLCYGCDH